MLNIYQALYRKWRPRSFDDVAGQQHITETLKNQVMLGRTSHAYIFVGTRGTGKTTCAKILAKAVNCESPVGGNPCNRCRSCVGIDSGAILDVEELDAASNNGVDNVRSLRDEAVYSPAHVKSRVYIIDEVHMLSTSAFNALLKILEEPPEHLMFILATTELHKVPPTILSRCQRHSFRRLAVSDIAKRLGHVAEEEGISLFPDAAELLARLGDGSMRDALSLLDQCASGEAVNADTVLSSLGLVGNLRTAELLGAIADGDIARTIDRFGALWNDGKDIAGLLGELSALMRDVLITKIAHGGSPLLAGGYDAKTLEHFSGMFSEKALLHGITRLQKSMGELRTSTQARVTAELCLVELCAGYAETESVERVTTAKPRKPKTATRDEGSKPIATEPEFTSLPHSAPAEEPEQNAPPPPPQSPPQPAPVVGPADGRFWEKLLLRVRDKVPPGNYSFLSEDFHARGELKNGELLVLVQNEFAMSMINLPAVLGALEAEARAMLGSACKARITLDEPPGAPSTEKLDTLSKFSNFTIV